MSLHETPRANRLHIGLFGLRNAGKSSLVNRLSGHEVAIVAPQAGTTTDPVYKSMEIHPLGPCVLVDTAGFDDEGDVGALRVQGTVKALDKTDVALLILAPESLGAEGEDDIRSWVRRLRKNNVPTLFVLNKIDTVPQAAREDLLSGLAGLLGERPLAASAVTGEGLEDIREALVRLVPPDWDDTGLTGTLVKEGDLVLLVMPQDIQAPKGRLILPQVQVMRDLLDRKCLVMSVTTDKLAEGLSSLRREPDLIITDSQVFPQVYAQKPPDSKLTSFSILLAAHKGDIGTLVRGAEALGKLTEQSRVLIAEACTHAPLAEDIGREKIPAFLRKRIGSGLGVDIVSGSDFPKDITYYDVVIHCGACMFNRKYMMNRILTAEEQGVPMTNYGVTLAWLGGILDKVALP